MKGMRRLPLLLAFCIAVPGGAEIPGGCACDTTRPETLAVHGCELCVEAEKQPSSPSVFFLRDASPRKPNRWLALPRAHGQGLHMLSAMTPAERAGFWSAAIEKAQSLWGGEWGIALNGPANRTQCHAHLHIGKFLTAAENARFLLVDGPAQIPLPPENQGLWVHPAGSKLHVHTGESATETVLLR
jgi:hypothetical protein